MKRIRSHNPVRLKPQPGRKIPFRSRFTAGLTAAGFISLSFVMVFFTALLRWEKKNWDDLKINEVIYQLRAPLEGTGNHMIETFLLTCLLPAGVAALAAAALLLVLRKQSVWKRFAGYASLTFAMISLGILSFAFVQLNVGPYLAGQTSSSTYIEENYADPKTTGLYFPEVRRNLIYIYVESLETTFADEAHGGAFPENYIPELTELALEGICFSGQEDVLNGGRSMTDTDWTVAGIFAQTAGLPLKIPVSANSMDTQDDFFPGIDTLGDILHAAGYRQDFILGSDVNFGGRRLLFREHGDYLLMDYKYALEYGLIPEGYGVWWGYEDQKLFQIAEDHLLELAGQNDTPFNVTLLTVDTHPYDGYVCDLCRNEFGDNQYANVLACTSRQVTDFVRWVQQQPFYENTTIIINGDHPTMQDSFVDSIRPDYVRKTCTIILNPADGLTEPNRFREYTTFDLFPTTLAALGVRIAGDRLGLGTNLFSEEETLLERDGETTMNAELYPRSDFLNSVSGFDSRIYTLRRELLKVPTSIDMLKGGDSVTYHLRTRGLKEEELDGLELKGYGYDEKNHSTLLWQTEMTRNRDGSYAVVIPEKDRQNYSDYYLQVFGVFEGARLQIGKIYAVDYNSQVLKKKGTDPAIPVSKRKGKYHEGDTSRNIRVGTE